MVEEEYGRNMQKLSRSTSETYATSDGKAGLVEIRASPASHLIFPHSTFVSAWQSSMKIHEIMADNRVRFAQRLHEMSEELATLAKEVDKNRKQVRSL